MPQLDPATYTSQIFWLAVTFLGLALLLWRVALPRISAALENRPQRIDHDIARSGELAKEAEGAMAAYAAEVSKGRGEAQEGNGTGSGRGRGGQYGVDWGGP